MMDTFPRGAQSFLEMDGTYNWTKPSGQLFFLKRARELGVEKIVAFSYSPHRRQTKNGLARASKAGNSIGADGDKLDYFSLVVPSGTSFDSLILAAQMDIRVRGPDFSAED